MALQSERSNLIRCGFEAAGIMSAIETGGDSKSGLGLGSTAAIFPGVANAVRISDSDRIGTEVLIIDPSRIPNSAQDF